MKKPPTPTLLLFILILASITTAYNNYNTPGYTAYNNYLPTGTLSINSTTAINIPGTLTTNGAPPLVNDIDNDGNNEIVLIRNDDYIFIQNFTGTAFSTLSSTDAGSPDRYGQNFHITPAISNINGDDYLDIVTINSTHALVYNYTLAAGLILSQSVAIPMTNSTGSFVDASPYITIKCSNAGNRNGIKICYFTYIDRDALGNYNINLYGYDLTNNTLLSVTTYNAWVNIAFSQYRQPSILDMGLDGTQDVMTGLYDSANGNLLVYYTQMPNATGLSTSRIATIDRTGNYFISDISTGNFDGVTSNGNEIAVLYQSAANNYESMIINRAGSNLTTSFTTTLPVTGATPFTNLAQAYNENGLLDYCAYIHYSSNTSTLACFDGNTGDYQKISGTTTGYTTTGGTFSMSDGLDQHAGIITGSYAAKTTATDVLGGDPRTFFLYWMTLYSYYSITPYYYIGPYTHTAIIDIRKLGKNDIIYSNSTNYGILNTLSTNSAPQIYAYGTGTGSPSCFGVVQKYRVTVSDAENDSLSCYFGYYYINDTLISNTTQSAVAGVQEEFLYTLSETGNFKAVITCGDAYNANSTSHTFIQSVVYSNTSACFTQDTGSTSGTTETEAAEQADADWDSATDELYTGLGVESNKARNILALFICLLAGILIYIKTDSGILSVTGVAAALLICYFANLATIFPVVIMVLVVISMLVWKFLGGNGASPQE